MKNIIFVIASLYLVLSMGCKDPVVTPPKYADPTPYTLELPAQMPIMDIPADNPLTVEGIALGRRLFYDPILSGDNTQSCSSCHQQDHGFIDEDKFSIGIDKIRGTRRAMPIVNVGYMKKLFWDGRASGVEDQALFPVEDPIEMHNIWPDAVAAVAGVAMYPDLFGAAFGTDKVTKDRIVKAIAQFERTLISANSRYDKIEYFETESYSEDELEGFELFYDEWGADCAHCHDGGLMTDNSFHNNGLDSEFADIGLAKITGNDFDKGKFKTPTLRNVALRAPYMHDGRFETLKEVLDHYSDGIKLSPTLDPLIEHSSNGGVQLTEEQKWQVIAFLKTMTDSSFINNPKFSSPF